MLRQNDTWHLSGINLSGFGKEFVYIFEAVFIFPAFFSIQQSHPFKILISDRSPLMVWFICITEVVFPTLRDTEKVFQQSSWKSDYIGSVDSMLQNIFFLQQDGVSHTFLLTNWQPTGCWLLRIMYNGPTATASLLSFHGLGVAGKRIEGFSLPLHQ